MTEYVIEIDDNAVREQIKNILNKVIDSEMSKRYGGTADVVRAAVKELIYAHKDEITERVVNQATREIVKKGIPLLLERGLNNENS